MAITAQTVKELRETTGAGMMDCKKALGETNGDFEKAIAWLREKGMASATKRADRAASEGRVASYIHMGGKVGVLAEVNCETDFVARNPEFEQLCHDICLQICSAAPKYVRREEVPADAVAAELDIYKKQAAETGKPEAICQKIAEGKLDKWYKDVCLLEQAFVKDGDKTIEQLVKELSGKVGEKIDVRRIARFERGEGIVKRESNIAEDVAQALKASEGK